MSRKTEFWKSNTPTQMGPGYYKTDPAHEVKQNKTAFLIKAARPLSHPKTYIRFTPGPGTYTVTDKWQNSSSHSSSTFVSKSKREVFSSEILQNSCTPGPGAYDTSALNVCPIRKKPKFSTLYVDPSPVSIPSRSQEAKSKIEAVENSERPSRAGTAFSKYRSGRKVFVPQTRSPGPGTYDVNQKPTTLYGWMFASKSARPNSRNTKIPGPGSYFPAEAEEPHSAGFSIAPRELPLSNDPHRPILIGCHDVPAVGSYKLEADLKKDEKLKAKFITGEVNSKIVPFNTNERREMQWVAKDEKPGPADYLVGKAVVKKGTGNFGSKMSRFNGDKVKDYPGPGTYDASTSINERASPVFSSRTPRFVRYRNNTPETYIGHQEWKVKKTRTDML